MITLRPAADRGRTEIGWLDSRHTFSFGDYYDPEAMGFRALRVLNDDRVAPGKGFGTHAHRDMEILSYVLDGELEHRDSIGNGSVIRPGEIQFMRAGTGVQHSEYNPSPREAVHFLQIWVVPEHRGLAPAYAQHRFDREAAKRGFTLLVSGDGRQGSVSVDRDVAVHVLQPESGAEHVLPLAAGRHAWVHVARGTATVLGLPVSAGDGIAVSQEPAIRIRGGDGAEILVFDLA
jgi:redox-sensitive bicupin YhaK (pirin superfamily)